MRAIEWRVQKTAKIHVDHSNSQLLLSSSTLLILFLYFCSSSQTGAQRQKPKGVLWLSFVPPLLPLLQNSTFPFATLRQNHAVNN